MSCSELSINGAVFLRAVHVPGGALFWMWEHRDVVPSLLSAKEHLIMVWTSSHFDRCDCS